MSNCKLINDNLSAIQKYCEKNSLNYDKLIHMHKSCGRNDVYFQHTGKNTDLNDNRIIIDDTEPAPVTLIMTVKDGKVKFEQTEYTHMYLKIKE